MGSKPSSGLQARPAAAGSSAVKAEYVDFRAMRSSSPIPALR